MLSLFLRAHSCRGCDLTFFLVFSFEFSLYVSRFMCLVCIFYFLFCVRKAILLRSLVALLQWPGTDHLQRVLHSLGPHCYTESVLSIYLLLFCAFPPKNKECRLYSDHTDHILSSYSKKLCTAAADHSSCHHCQDPTCTPIITGKSITFANTSVQTLILYHMVNSDH